jgi:hypothetical protein
MKTFRRLVPLTLAACLMAAGAASAGSITCNSLSVTHLWVYAQSGSLIATVTAPDVPQSSWALCRMDLQVGNVKPEMCQELYNQLVMAKVTGATAQIAFSDAIKKSDGTPVQTCAEIPPWNVGLISPYVLYVRVNP